MGEKIGVWLVFEVLSSSEETAKKSLEAHFERFSKEEGITIKSSSFEDIQKVEKPMAKLDVGYSLVLEVEGDVTSFSRLIELVISYGPSLVEIQSPSSLTLSMGDAQEALTLVSEMMHRFAETGVGGVVISSS